MDEITSFGYWVRRRRKALDLTQAVLAHQVGCATVTIRKIEADERRPSRIMAERLAACLGIPQGEWNAFIRSGLGEVSVQGMPVPTEPVSKSQDLEDNQQSAVFPSTLEARAAARINLPAQVTPFIGREGELAEIRANLMPEIIFLFVILRLLLKLELDFLHPFHLKLSDRR